jgi:hypothetical protein
MAFVTISLPNGGRTTHFAIFYDDKLVPSAGLDRALDLLNFCESDLALIQSWFMGINFQFAFPISVQITGDSGGASWTDPPDFALWFGFHPSIDLMPGPTPTTELLRYFLVSEITEMFMASQRKYWFGDTHWSGADEGSMGESLSRFLASEFLTTTGIATAIFSGFNVANIFLNDFLRPNFVDISADDNSPDIITGCGTCFIFFLKYQLGFSIQQIIAASAGTLGGVYTNLTGKTDGWQTFKNLLDVHYPHAIGGTSYFPPLDNVFPVADLQSLTAPMELSWAFNSTPNVAWLSLNHPLPVNVDVMLSSDDPGTIDVPASVSLNSSLTVMLTVPQQSAAFIPKMVTLTASYAGKQLTAAINIVRPEALPVATLQIVPTSDDNPCAQLLVEATSQPFVVKNPNVIMDQRGLTYNWMVAGANAAITDQPTLTIASLPAAGTKVTINVSLSNAVGIRAEGKYDFTTTQRQTGFREQVRQLDCSLRQLRAINAQIAPWVPVERGEILLDAEQLARIENESKSVALAAQRVLAAAKAVRSTIPAKEQHL